ncbi:hypothetical protein [Rhodopirellula sp. MGV]|uniref:hypothetical protein n=1 Tax=Rhodopirellula sp. MGV TaxID=2023130 RepID=UPI00117A24B2|nr:hypothetical protein [Rhodopirellula sp. MGV]
MPRLSFPAFPLCAVAAFLVASSLLGESTPVFSQVAFQNMSLSLPPPDNSGKTTPSAGLVASIDLTNLHFVGSVGVNARIDSTMGPLSRQRKLAIRLTPIGTHLPANNASTVLLPATFEQGQSRVELNDVFSKWTIGETYKIELLEDGEPLPNYNALIGQSLSEQVMTRIDVAMPNEVMLNVGLIGVEQKTNDAPSDASYFSVYSRIAFQQFDPRMLPTDWRLYEQLDCLVIDEQSLLNMPTVPKVDASHWQAVIEAIRFWTMQGGVLICVPTSEPLTGHQALLDKVIEKLRLKPHESLVDRESLLASNRQLLDGSRQVLDFAEQWADQVSTPPANLGAGTPPQPPMQAQLQRGQWIPTHLLSTNAEDIQALRTWIDDSRESIDRAQQAWDAAIVRPASMGSLMVLDRDAFVSSMTVQPLESQFAQQVAPMLRRGVDPILGDNRHQRWLIPGVAQPPVYTFMGILTLFVILVGPIAYRWSTRSHRSHLMFVIAPLLALFTTLAMFSYSIVADGFGTLVRVRQLTWIDGASGDASERSRATLFAGISPNAGSSFDTEAEVMLYPNNDIAWRNIPSRITDIRKQVTIDNESQHFSSSFLPSRTQTQFVTHRVREQIGKIQIGELRTFSSSNTAANQSTLTVTSSLPFDVTDLVIRTEDGRYFGAARLPAGETVEATWLAEVRDSSKRLGKLYTDHRPIGAVTTQSGRSAQVRRDPEIKDLLAQFGRMTSPGYSQTLDGLLEIWLNQFLFVKGDLPNGTFVGLSTITDDVIPVSDAEAVDSVRYVMGTLP